MQMFRPAHLHVAEPEMMTASVLHRATLSSDAGWSHLAENTGGTLQLAPPVQQQLEAGVASESQKRHDGHTDDLDPGADVRREEEEEADGQRLAHL